MLEENIPKSNYAQLRPKTGRPKISFQNDKNNILTSNEDKVETKVITESIEESKNENEIQNIKEQLLEKTQFLEALGNDKYTFDNLLLKEINRMKNINGKKTILKDINLIEKNYDDLYEWTNLFNNSRPISSYTTLKKTKLNISEDNKNPEFKSPVVLVDLFEDQMNLYFGKNNFINTESKDSKKKIKNKLLNNKTKKFKNQKKLSLNISSGNNIKSKSNNKYKEKIINISNTQNNNTNSKNINYNYIRPMSVYSPRLNSCSFYFSSAFSDYYKEDLKTFSEKMKILKAKVKSNPNKLNHEIKIQRNISSKKEIKLNKILNFRQFNFGKENLIIAADRKNPLPLLKNIFKQTYPNKELMKEHLKMYFNTMKPLGEFEGPIDYTKNERWRLSEQIAEMRAGKKNLKVKYDKNLTNNNSFNNKKIKAKSNLILSYYNDKDPYIQMFDKMIQKEKNNINSYKESETNLTNNKKYFNPILQNFDNNVSILFNKKIIEEKKESDKQIYKNKNENKNKNKKILEENIKKKYIHKNNLNNIINIRPKTSNKLVGSNVNNPFIKRPLTSIFKQYNILYTNPNQEKRNSLTKNNNDSKSNLEYISSYCFPLKTISNVGNASYDKINQMIQERQLLKNDYFITSTGQIKSISNYPKYMEEKIILEKNNNIKNRTLSENNKWNDNFNKYKYNKKNKINYYNFNNVMNYLNKKDKNDKKTDNFYTLKYFKNMGGKYYSSSNNVNVKNKRNNKIKLLNNFYTESKYSRDDQEPEIDFVDEAISSQTNSSYRKI